MARASTSTARWLGVLCLMAACSEGRSGGIDAHLPDGGSDDLSEATQLLELSRALPNRAEVVALTDRLAITASQAVDAGPPATPVQLRFVAAQLRERLWRLDGQGSDGREAIALFKQVVDDPAAGDLSCDADWRRARLAGEVLSDAALGYRELFLATERQATEHAATSPKNGSQRDACLARLRDMLTRVQAFRPTGQAWQALQQEGARLALPPVAASSGPVAALSAAPKEGFTGEPIVVKPPPSILPKEAATLSKIQPYSWKHGGRIVLELSGPATYSTGTLKPDPKTGKGHRIFVDIERVKVKGKKHRNLSTDGLIERVRMATRNDGVRVVLDLSQEVERRIFYLPNPFRVMIDVGTRIEPDAPKAQPVARGKRLVRRVTLDPGHGGWDAGAVGPTGLMEKDVALDVAHRAAPALAAELGIETMLTRDTDAFIDLEERTARANAFRSDMFISIHCNATENGEAQGHEIFILDPSRQGDRHSYVTLARENGSRPGGGQLDPGAMDAQVASIARGLGLAGLPEDSRVFADLLQKSMGSSLASRYAGAHDHGVKTAGFYVLVGAQMPAVLFETAFISNTDDEARLSTADFRQKLADAIVNAVRAYRDGL